MGMVIGCMQCRLNPMTDMPGKVQKANMKFITGVSNVWINMEKWHWDQELSERLGWQKGLCPEALRTSRKNSVDWVYPFFLRENLSPIRLIRKIQKSGGRLIAILRRW